MKKILTAIALSNVLMGCGGITEGNPEGFGGSGGLIGAGGSSPELANYPPNDLPFTFTDVFPEDSGYLWSSVATPRAYRTHGLYTADFQSHWGDRCELAVNGETVESIDGALPQNAIVYVWGCPFELTFSLVE